MIFECKNRIKHCVLLLLLAIVVSCCPAYYTQGMVYIPEAAGKCESASIYASYSPIDTLITTDVEKKESYISDNSQGQPHRIHFDKSTMLFCSTAISLFAAVLCISILHAVTKATSANLYIIRYIHSTDGMK